MTPLKLDGVNNVQVVDEIHGEILLKNGALPIYDAIIVGGGAAGFFAAVTCAERRPGARVLILERSSQVLSKVRVSGGGRCNVTHACFDPRDLIGYYPRGGKELLGPFHTWSPVETMEWFEGNGVALKEEEDGRVFPVSDDSRSIVDCLRHEAKRHGVEIQTSVGVKSISTTQVGFELQTNTSRGFRARSLLLATGGLKRGGLTDQIRALGHRIEPLAPSLFTFHLKDARLKDLAGLAVPSVLVEVEGGDLKADGPLLVTHWGVSGPAVLKLSSWGARRMQERGYRFAIRMNWTGESQIQKVSEELDSMRRSSSRKLVKSTPLWSIPRRLWERLVAAAGIRQKENWARVSSAQLRALTIELTAGRFEVIGKSMNKEEFVTCGGVCLSEVQFKNMESKLVTGLYFAGEILDIDALTGGFNFQAAWTTGFLAGRSIAQRSEA